MEQEIITCGGIKQISEITELVFILDRSGSMHGMEADTIGGFNAMIQKQKELEGKVYVSTVLFSDQSTVLHDRVDLKEVEELAEKDYYVGGCTALLDAIGSAIKHISNVHKYARPEDVPTHTMFVITTDGMENASVRYNSKMVKEMITQKEKQGWEFLFLASNIDAVETARTMGINKDRAVNYCVKEDTVNMFSQVNDTLVSFRKCGSVGEGWAVSMENSLKDKRKKK